MPSFAKAKTNGSPSPAAHVSMSDVFSAGDMVDEVLAAQRSMSRTRARLIIQQDLPLFINHLQGIIQESETNTQSFLHPSRTNEGDFLASSVRLVRPEASQPAAKHPKPTEPRPPTSPSKLNYGNPDGSAHPVAEELMLALSPSEAKSDQPSAALSTALNGSSERSKMVLGGMGGEDGDDDEGIAAGTRWLGGLKSNVICDRLMNLIEVESETCMTMMKELLHYIHLCQPPMEDGNNFGVEVQDQVANMLDRTLTSALKLHGLPRSHYQDRMNLATSWNRYPNLEDHAAAIASSDRFDHFLATNALRSLRNNVVAALLTMKENWVKVSDPKGLEDGHGTVAGMGMY